MLSVLWDARRALGSHGKTMTPGFKKLRFEMFVNSGDRWDQTEKCM